jgi:hypothetical protein
MATSEKQYVTLAHANSKVRALAGMFGSVLQLRTQLKGMYRSMAAAGYKPELDAKDEDVPAGSTTDLAVYRGLAETLRDQIEAILATGCVIKDIETGLVDWLAVHEGREIWLCWRYGEPHVTHWHELNGGYDGRRPVSELASATS